MSTSRRFLFFFAFVVIVVRPLIAADSLVVSPAHPTIMDSIRLSILIRTFACCIEYVRDFQNPDCCIQYSHDSTAVTLVSDSTIALGFSKSMPQGICSCPINLPDSMTADIAYKRGPLPAGNYSVYEDYQSCTGQICSDVVMQTLIGKFMVSEPTATVFRQKPVPLENIGKTSGNGCVYNIRGEIMSPNQVGASKRTPGVYFIKPDERSAAQLKVWY